MKTIKETFAQLLPSFKPLIELWENPTFRENFERNVRKASTGVAVIPDKRTELFNAIKHKIEHTQHEDFNSLMNGCSITSKINHSLQQNQLADIFGKMFKNKFMNVKDATALNRWLSKNFSNYKDNTKSFAALVFRTPCKKTIIKIEKGNIIGVE